MTDATEMPQYDGMEYEELVAAAQFLWMENAKLRELVRKMYGATLFSCSECWISRTFNPAECDNENCDNRKDYLTMRELGIEVSNG